MANEKVGANGPTEQTKQDIGNMVDDVLGLTPPDSDKEKAEETTNDSKRTADETKSLDPDKESDDSEDESGEEDESEGGEVKAEETEAEDEEVVPKSKHQKALEKQQARIDELTNKLKQMEDTNEKASDSQEAKLERLSNDELAELKDNADEAIMDAKVDAKVNGTDTSARIAELKALKRSIDKTIQEAPQRFQKKQIENLNKIIKDVAEIDPLVTQKKGDLFAIASRIYANSPSLQRSVTGQAEAMVFAAQHYQSMKSSESGKAKVSTLSQKVNSLKKKTSLEGNSRKVSASDESSKKVRSKALRGTYDDKLDFIKTLVPDEYLES